MNGIGNRLRTIRKELDLKQGAFAKRIEMSQGMLSDIEHEKAVLTERNIKLICLEFGVDREWLLTGQGTIFTLPKPSPQASEWPDGRALADDERELIEIYDRLAPETRKEVRDYISEKLELQYLRAKMGGTNPLNITTESLNRSEAAGEKATHPIRDMESMSTEVDDDVIEKIAT
jgi:transcriptional regulator with XRE-family HTH domain